MLLNFDYRFVVWVRHWFFLAFTKVIAVIFARTIIVDSCHFRAQESTVVLLQLNFLLVNEQTNIHIFGKGVKWFG